jgi:transposase
LQTRRERRHPTKIIRFTSVLLLFVLAGILSSRAQSQPQPASLTPSPEPAVPAILAAFDQYEVVGMTEAHGDKDVDDFIFSLIRTPAFLEKLNDIAVKCGNSLYQPILDRYIAGEDVPFTEVRKVWRNTTQPMCDLSGFFEQLFPLVRAINQKLPPEKRLRVLAGDPPIDWDQIKTDHDKGEVCGDARGYHRIGDGERGSLKTSQGSHAVRYASSPARN